MGYKILLADDSVTVQKIISLTFSDEGVDVVTVNNGDEAISQLQYLRPALVMADVSIPGRNGYEICEFVKIHPEMKETPVILLVPAFEPFDEERARRIGADYHLTKPFRSIRTLISTVKSLAERKAAAEFSVLGSGLTAVRGSDQNNSVTVDMDPKRAKLEKLIRLSADEPLEKAVEDDVLLEVELTQGDGRYSESLSVEGPSDLGEAIDAARGVSTEDPLARVAQTSDVGAHESGVAPEAPEAPEALDSTMDNILELEDVLVNMTSAHPLKRAEMVERAEMVADVKPADAQPILSAEDIENQSGVVLPQYAIDEIVNRVSAQLSEKLSEKLSGEIAHRIAPEVARLIKHQLLTEPAVYRNSENLLDLE